MSEPARSRVLRGAEAARVRRIDLGHQIDLTSRAPHVPPEVMHAAHEEGRAAGYRDGYAAGLAAAEEEARGIHAQWQGRAERALRALDAAVDECRTCCRVDAEALEDELAAAAFDIAEAVVGRELAVATDPGRDAVARALALASGWAPVVARLHPDDLAVIGDLADLTNGRDVTLVPDTSVEPGGCVAEVAGARIDAQLGPALERVRQELAAR